MSERAWERAGAASGIAMVLFGAAAEVFERAPVTAADFAANRSALLTQSMLFLLGSAFALWFLGALRSHLLRYEGGSGTVSTIAFGAGVSWVVLNMMAQAFQVGLADDPSGDAPSVVLRIAIATFTIANLPLAVMLIAVAVVSLRLHAFPVWLGGIAGVAAIAHTVLFLATSIDSGPLAADGWLSFALYPFFLIWLVPTSVIMMRRAGGPQPIDPQPAADAELRSAPSR